MGDCDIVGHILYFEAMYLDSMAGDIKLLLDYVGSGCCHDLCAEGLCLSFDLVPVSVLVEHIFQGCGGLKVGLKYKSMMTMLWSLTPGIVF